MTADVVREPLVHDIAHQLAVGFAPLLALVIEYDQVILGPHRRCDVSAWPLPDLLRLIARCAASKVQQFAPARISVQLRMLARDSRSRCRTAHHTRILP